MSKRRFIVLPLTFLALVSASCSRPVDDSAAVAVAAVAPPAPAEAANEPIYRVPADDFPSMGARDALVTIVVFSDYECPYCRKLEGTLAKLRASFGDDVRVAVAARPLPMHDHARPAALAALAAAQQGRFEQMHARLMANEALDDDALRDSAQAAGLDMRRFERDRGGDQTTKALVAAEGLASRLGVTGTPTCFVNGRRVAGAQSYEDFAGVVADRLAAARALVATGVHPSRVYETTIARGIDRVVNDAKEVCDENGHCGKDADQIGNAVESVPVAGSPARGPEGAPITIVTFADFDCPYSAKAFTTLRALEKAHPEQVRIVFKQLPLPFHDNARIAARASLAAAAQGRFWDYHDMLFAHATAHDRASLEKYAREVGLDMARFARDLDDPATDARIDAELAEARALRVNGTPTTFVNGHRVLGAQPEALFEKAIAKR